MHINASSCRYSTLLIRALLKRVDLDAAAHIGPVSLTNSSFRFDRQRLERYRNYFGFNQHSLPLPFLFIATQNEQLQLFTHSRTAIRPLGLVHTHIEFEQLVELDPMQTYQFKLELQNERRIERGLAFEVLGTFFCNGEKVAFYRSGYLMLMPQKRSGSKAKNSSLPIERSQISRFTLDVKQAREYARLSGDFNPIHLAKWSAKLFGFNSPIIHGMYMVARLQALISDTSLPDPAAFVFKRPILLPSEVKIVKEGNKTLVINSEGKPLIEMNPSGMMTNNSEYASQLRTTTLIYNLGQ